MPHRTSPSPVPPFPSDLPHAPIARISSAALLSPSAETLSSVLEACQTHGFFYLDLSDSAPGRALLSQADDLRSLAEDVFASPLEAKMPYHLERGVSLFGFKAAGTVKTTDATQRPDSTEFFCVAKDHVLGVSPSRSYPDAITSRKELFADFSRGAHAVGMAVCSALETQLGLEDGELKEKARIDLESGDHVRLTWKTAAQRESAIGLPSHTDFGCVTVLFNWLGGLQIESQEHPGTWEWVVPVEGCAIVNLGDAMVTFTNGTLKSAKHRVVPPPGEQAALDRYSVVYFVRPHDSALMKPLPKFDTGARVKVGGKFGEQLAGAEEEKVLSAGEWITMRAKQLGN